MLLHPKPRRGGSVNSCPQRAADQPCSRHGGVITPEEAGDVRQEPSCSHVLEGEVDLRGGSGDLGADLSIPDLAPDARLLHSSGRILKLRD